MEGYVYTLTYNGGLKEHHGTFGRITYKGRMFYKDKGGYLTSTPVNEGEVFNSTIWFSERNMEGARKVFSERAKRTRNQYMDKCVRQEHYILKAKEE